MYDTAGVVGNVYYIYMYLDIYKQVYKWKTNHLYNKKHKTIGIHTNNAMCLSTFLLFRRSYMHNDVIAFLSHLVSFKI